MKAVTHLEKVIAGETSAVKYLEKVVAQETTAVTYTEKVIAGEASPITYLQKVIAGVARPVTHLEYVWAGGSPPSVQEYTGAVPVTFTADGTPLLDFLISGNMSQNGTPTPDNPIMPEGTGELETVGAKAGWYKIPISSAGQTKTIYLGQVPTTRKIKKLVLTGEEETWDTISGNAPYRIQLPDIVQTSDKTIVLFTSSHYLAVSNNAFWDRYTTCVSWTFLGGVNVKCLVFRDRNQATLADFKAYLAQQYAAGTPVCVWYVLSTSQTAVVNEPLMRIGDYTDSISKAQAGVEIPTVNGSTTLDVETTVKPSEVYIKYRGEAVATLSILSAEVSSPEETPEEVNPEETEETENGSENISLQHKPEAVE